MNRQALPQKTRITATEALTWLGLGEAKTWEELQAEEDQFFKLWGLSNPEEILSNFPEEYSEIAADVENRLSRKIGVEEAERLLRGQIQQRNLVTRGLSWAERRIFEAMESRDLIGFGIHRNGKEVEIIPGIQVRRSDICFEGDCIIQKRPYPTPLEDIFASSPRKELTFWKEVRFETYGIGRIIAD